MGHRERGARTVGFLGSGMLAPSHCDDTVVSLALSWAYTRHCTLLQLEAGDVRQTGSKWKIILLVILSVTQHMCVFCVVCLCILCCVSYLCSSSSCVALVGIWSYDVWINADHIATITYFIIFCCLGGKLCQGQATLVFFTSVLSGSITSPWTVQHSVNSC